MDNNAQKARDGGLKNRFRFPAFLFRMVAALLPLAACNKDNGEDALSLIERHGLAGAFAAQITPTFMGESPMASGEHTVHFEATGDGRLRMHFEKFRAAPMPFEMTVDIVMEAKPGPDGTVLLEGGEGTFRAAPPNGGAIDPGDAPAGIQLPPGSESGLSSTEAAISGRYAEVEMDGQTAWRYDLRLSPGVPLPIEVLICTKDKKQAR